MKRLILACLLWPAIAVADVEIGDAWIKQLPPSVPMRAGYLILHNSGSSEVVLIGAASSAFERVEIHRSFEQDGMMRMEPVDEIRIPAGGSFRLEPGGYHLMMMMPQVDLLPGDEVELELEFLDGQRQTLHMTVKK